MKGFSTAVVKKEVTRFFVLGRGYANATQAYRALAKKEIAAYAAIKVLPAARLEGDLNRHDGVKDALGWLFDDKEEGMPWLGYGSAYRRWVDARARELAKGAEPMIKKTTAQADVGGDDWVEFPCWEVGFKLGAPWPKEDYVLSILARGTPRHEPRPEKPDAFADV